MLVATFVVFVLSILGLGALFALKHRELQHGQVVAPGFRAWADTQARALKLFLGRSNSEFAKVVPAVIVILRFGVHELALLLAAGARMLERQAHRLADMVSHKHRFERRESKSEFLKQVGEYKQGGQSEVDKE